MKIDRSSARVIMRIVLCGILFFFLLWNISVVWRTLVWILGILTPLIVGLCFAFIINPLVRSLERLLAKLWKRPPSNRSRGACRALSILFSFIIVFGVLTVLLLIIMPEVSSTIRGFVKELPKTVNNVLAWVRTLPFDISFVEALLAEQPDWEKLIGSVSDFFKNGAGTDMVNGVVGATVSLLGGLWDVIMGLIISIYALGQKESIGRFFSRFTKAFFPKRAERIFYISRLANEAFSNFVMGQLIEALIIGVLCYIGMQIFRFPYALTIATIVALSALIPVFGAWIGAILGALLILTVSPIQALWFLIFLVILQQLEGNLIYPRVVGKSVGLPALLVMMAVWVGGSVSGVVGMLFAVPLTSLCYTLIKESISLRIDPPDAPEPEKPEPPPEPEKTAPCE